MHIGLFRLYVKTHWRGVPTLRRTKMIEDTRLADLIKHTASLRQCLEATIMEVQAKDREIKRLKSASFCTRLRWVFTGVKA